VEIRAFDDLDLPASGTGHDFAHFRPLISCIGEGPLDEWKTPPRLAQQIAGAIAVLNVGGQALEETYSILSGCERKYTTHEIQELRVIDMLRLPRRIGVVVKTIGILRQVAKFVDIRLT
jgi:hypothetical protein